MRQGGRQEGPWLGRHNVAAKPTENIPMRDDKLVTCSAGGVTFSVVGDINR